VSDVAVYIRWSTEDQGQGTTLEVQLEACRQYCDRQGWFVHDEMFFIDEGYSGGSLLRPALTRLRKLVGSGQVGTVLVYRLDRLSRNLADATNLVDKEFKNKAVVRSATEEVQPEADEGWLNYSFRAAFADYERRVIRQRTMSGRTRRAQEGRKAHGKIPFGWRQTNKPGFLEVHPEHAEVVREFFKRCVYENSGCPALSRWANALGIPSPEDNKWHQSVIRRLLQNPIYGGRIVFGQWKQFKQNAAEPGPWRQRRTPMVDVEADPHCLPPIIERELWEMAQRAIQARGEHAVRGRAVSNPHLLSGILYCRCGSKMGPKTAGKTQRRIVGMVYYRCYRDEEVEPCPFQSGYLEASMLEARIEAELLSHLDSDVMRLGLADRLKEREHNETGLLTAELRRVEQELRKLELELAYVDKQFRREEVTITEARRLRAGIDLEATQLRARQDEITAQMSQDETAELDHRLLVAQLDLVSKWDRLTVLEKKQVMANFIKGIEAYRPRNGGEADVTIDWRFGDTTEHQVAQPVRRRNTQ
jgi:site-specific DNA recombinase